MMYRLAIVPLLVGVAVMSPAIAGTVDRTETEQDAAIDRLLCTVYSEDCATPEPHTPTATNTPEATPTPDLTPTVTQTPVLSGWHTATNHEHGDPVPSWADAWSLQALGHPVVYGGDEATPNENMMKHEAYKGYSATKDGVSFYVRVHEASNPMDRGVRWHSYEVYAKDATGAVSFWQGWLDRGDPATQRIAVCGTNADATHPLKGTPHGWVSYGCGAETWYTRGQNWQWDIVTVINDATTTVQDGESASDPQPSWVLTGAKGVNRQLAAYFYEDSATRYPTRNDPSPRGWFCATAQGVISGAVAEPGACPSGELPQFIAPTMPSVETAAYSYHVVSCPSCEVPN